MWVCGVELSLEREKARIYLHHSVRAVTRELVGNIVNRPQRRCDRVRDLAYEQPMRVLWAEPLLGDPLVPIGSAGSAASTTFRSWVHDFKHDLQRTSAAAALMRSHVEAVLEDRRRHPHPRRAARPDGVRRRRRPLLRRHSGGDHGAALSRAGGVACRVSGASGLGSVAGVEGTD